MSCVHASTRPLASALQPLKTTEAHFREFCHVAIQFPLDDSFKIGHGSSGSDARDLAEAFSTWAAGDLPQRDMGKRFNFTQRPVYGGSMPPTKATRSRAERAACPPGSYLRHRTGLRVAYHSSPPVGHRVQYSLKEHIVKDSQLVGPSRSSC
ncbi:hypothetical protein C8T65DRAFT_700281 [Cerioporus squamosus]|nr:hypothetical protein C8T65DRAFT_700281 [Cerioporus squamosus]